MKSNNYTNIIHERITLEQNKLMLGLFMLLGFVLPISRAGINIFGIMLLLGWLYQQFKYKILLTSLAHVWRDQSLRWCYIFITYSFVSLLWSAPYTHWQHEIVRRFVYLIVFPVIMFTSLNSKQVLYILAAFLAGMLVSVIISTGIFFGVWQTKTSIAYNLPTPFMSHIQYSLFLALTAVFLLTRIIKAQNNKKRWFYIVFFCIVTANLFVSGGRTGQLAFLIAGVSIAFLLFERKLRAVFIAFVLGITISTVAYLTVNTFKQRVDSAISNVEEALGGGKVCTSWGIRLIAYPVVLDMIKEAPVFGAGLFGDKETALQIINAKYPEAACLKTHLDYQNQFLLILAELGILGLITYLVFLIKLALNKPRSVTIRDLKFVFLAVFLVFFFSEALVYQFSSALFAFVLALIVTNSKPDSVENNN